MMKAKYIFLLALLWTSPCGAQSGEFEIKWIAEFPGKNGEKSQGIGEKFSRILFGKRPQVVVKPFHVVAESPDHYWILDQGAGTLFEVDHGEGRQHRSMKRAIPDFPSLVGMCEGPDETLLFSDSRLNQVWKISGGELSLFSDSAHLRQPTGIAYNRSSGEYWLVETGANRISLFNREGEWIRSIGERGVAPGSFNFPTFIWIDSSGCVYIVDSMNFRVQIFDSQGDFLDAFGASGDATGDMARPKGVAVDSKGHIYVADALFHVVQIFDRSGRFLYSFGGQGREEGEFWMPVGIYIDRQDFIYVADSYNSRVQVFQLIRN
ncbi:MAG: 6-bladed beta-propeller [Bacteroidales bacterium]